MQSEEFRINIQNRSLDFAIQIVRLVQRFPRTTAGYAIGSQIVKSGTSIGANIQEAQSASSRKDFIHCLTISLKEARETHYWLKIIKESKLIDDQVDLLLKEIDEIIRILVSIINKTKGNS